jgi:hypothetical protein
VKLQHLEILVGERGGEKGISIVRALSKHSRPPQEVTNELPVIEDGWSWLADHPKSVLKELRQSRQGKGEEKTCKANWSVLQSSFLALG